MAVFGTFVRPGTQQNPFMSLTEKVTRFATVTCGGITVATEDTTLLQQVMGLIQKTSSRIFAHLILYSMFPCLCSYHLYLVLNTTHFLR